MNATPERRQIHPDVERLLDAVLTGQDRMVDMQAAIEALPARTGKAMQAAIMRSASDPALWSAAASALQRHARDQAGGFLFGGLRGGAMLIGWTAVALLSAYMLGGAKALAAAWQYIFGPH